MWTDSPSTEVSLKEERLILIGKEEKQIQAELGRYFDYFLLTRALTVSDSVLQYRVNLAA